MEATNIWNLHEGFQCSTAEYLSGWALESDSLGYNPPLTVLLRFISKVGIIILPVLPVNELVNTQL